MQVIAGGQQIIGTGELLDHTGEGRYISRTRPDVGWVGDRMLADLGEICREIGDRFGRRRAREDTLPIRLIDSLIIRSQRNVEMLL